MKKISLLSYLLLITAIYNLNAQSSIPLPSNAQIMWHNAERVMLIHWGPATWQNLEYDNRTTNLNDIHPSAYSTDQWCEVARSWGATMIIFAAKHIGGFCWWQTQTSNYGVKELKWKDGKADVMKDLSISCKKYGLLLGVYISTNDDSWSTDMGSEEIYKGTSGQETYNKLFRQQLTEILSNYGKISEIWFDGNCKINVKDILDRYASDAVVFQSKDASLRWAGNEEGIVPYPNWYTLNKEELNLGNTTALASDVNGEVYAPVEANVPLLNNKGHKWFWSIDSDSLLMSVEQLMKIYYKSVGRGSSLVLNATPDTSGLIPLSHSKVYEDFGKEINKRFLFPVRFSSGKINFMYLQLREPTNINHILIQEDLVYGQRILEYEVKGLTNGKWVSLCKGSSVGNKRINFFKDIVVEAVKLNIINCKDTPIIKLFAAYNVQTNLNDIRSYFTLTEPVPVDYWDKDSFIDDSYKEVNIDLTDYIYQDGEYILSFDQLSKDYRTDKSADLQFSDVTLEIHEKTHILHNKTNKHTIKQINASQFLISLSQQTLKEFPVRFKAKIKNYGPNSVGEITLKRLGN